MGCIIKTALSKLLKMWCEFWTPLLSGSLEFNLVWNSLCADVPFYNNVLSFSNTMGSIVTPTWNSLLKLSISDKMFLCGLLAQCWKDTVNVQNHAAPTGGNETNFGATVFLLTMWFEPIRDHMSHEEFLAPHNQTNMSMWWCHWRHMMLSLNEEEERGHSGLLARPSGCCSLSCHPVLGLSLPTSSGQ